MTNVIASKALELADKLKDRNEPAIAEMTRRLRKYAEAEKGLAGSVHTMGNKATGLVVYGLHVADWAKKNKGPEADAFKKREKDFAKVVDSFEALGDAVDALLEGGTPAKVKLPGNAMQKMLDSLQFKDQVKVANLHKAALDYYPAESAGQKKLQEFVKKNNDDFSKKLKEANPGMAGIDVRGSLNWATIHPGFMTMYSSYGCKDYDENMVPQMNSECAVTVTKAWIDMVKNAGPEAWTTYTWYQAGSDFGAGKAATMFDADILGYFQNQPDAAAPEVLGNVAWAPGPRGPDGQLKTNIWIWSLAMNAGSQKKDAAWYFLQWATGKDFLTTGAVDYNMVNPVRQSVIDNPDFQARMAEQTDYLKTLQTISSEDMKIQFTPQPLFFETTTEWAQALQDIYAGADAQTRLDDLVKSLTQQLQDAGILQ